MVALELQRREEVPRLLIACGHRQELARELVGARGVDASLVDELAHILAGDDPGAQEGVDELRVEGCEAKGAGGALGGEPAMAWMEMFVKRKICVNLLNGVLNIVEK